MKTKSAIVFFILMAFGLSLNAQKTSKDSTIIIKTSAVCDMCKERIERNLAFEKGVKEVWVDVDAKTVKVTFRKGKTTVEKIKKALSNLGYRADEIPANSDAFKKLPECCKAEGCGKD